MAPADAAGDAAPKRPARRRSTKAAAEGEPPAGAEAA
jgi:hypothetical protein